MTGKRRDRSVSLRELEKKKQKKKNNNNNKIKQTDKQKTSKLTLSKS